MGVLPGALLAANIPLVTQVVYETVSIDGIGSLVHTVLVSPDPPQWLVFFSPSGVEAVAPAIKACVGGTLKVAAIGGTTAAALKANGVAVAAVALKPSAEGLTAAITAADGR